MTSNLVNFTSSSGPLASVASEAVEAEVNNNNNDNGKCLVASEQPHEDIPEHSIYTLNQDRKIIVSSPEEWLCVARLPLDFTQTEFESLLTDYGPVQQCFLIHSEISGKAKESVIGIFALKIILEF